MSRFSLRCDLWDWLEMMKEPFETLYECYLRLHTELYPGLKGDTPIIIEKPSDLVPYYPCYDAMHIYEEGKRDTHWLVPPEYGEYGMFFKDAIYSEVQKAIAEEDPKYVQEV